MPPKPKQPRRNKEYNHAKSAPDLHHQFAQQKQLSIVLEVSKESAASNIVSGENNNTSETGPAATNENQNQ